ncbi:MAG: hypothetical protein U9R58_11350 [Chloroflexota bacterium]|nr:hypothetical protein [Chloroflexota bacterium]
MTENNQATQNPQELKDKRQPFLDLPTRYDSWEPWVEFIATFVLALATVATAWSGFQSARWGGEQSTKFSQAGALRTESTRASTKAGQLVQIDIGLFTNWINAYAEDNSQLVNFYEKRFREEFMPAFDAWLATDPVNNPDSPPSPFTMPEYQISLAEEADRLTAEAENSFAEGDEANQISDRYVLNTVFLASVLFLAGIQQRFKSFIVKISLVTFGLLILMYGLYNIITLPVI